MARSSFLDTQQGNRTERLRRYLNASRNADAYARFRARRKNSRQLREQLEDARGTFHREDILEDRYEDHPNSHRDATDSETEPEDECEWVEIHEEGTLNPIDSIIEARKAQHRELAKQHNYSIMIESLHSEYMRLKFKTKNWAGSWASNDFRNCNFLPSNKSARLVDLVDISGQSRTTVKFCPCTKDTVTLLQLGYMAGSPMKPQTAFSMPLMIFHNHLWNNCHVGTMPFTLALRDYLEPRSQRLHAKNSSHARDLRRPFSAAVDMFRLLEDMTDNLNFRYLQLTKQQILANVTCPACFGPQPPNINVYPQSTRDQLVICLDGNFQHRHHSKASRDHGRLHIPRIFLDPIEVQAATQEIRCQEQLINTPAQVSDTESHHHTSADEFCAAPNPTKADQCTESHKAADDKRNESTWKGCNDTGLMGCCCRHDAAVYFANIHKSGEQRCLPMAIINRLLEELEPGRPVSILYDIGCSLDKFINLRDRLSDNRLRIKFGTSIVHAYVHDWLCQLKYNPRFNTGWGLSDGEGLERMWSYLSPLVSPLRYATRNHCLGAIAHRLKYHNQRGIKQLIYWLRRKFNNAIKRRHETRSLLAGLLLTPNPHKSNGSHYTCGFFKRQWKKQREFQSAHTQEEDERRKKLVNLYKEEAVLDHLRNRLKGPELFLGTESEVKELLDRITERAKQLKCDAEDLRRLNSSHLSAEKQKEEKLLLLLWDAKSKLFVQAVHLRAKREPIINSKTMGARLGTKLKEKIFKATLADFNGTLTYDMFAAMNLNDPFWNDGLYYHCKAPWAIDPNVRTGINCVLLLGRIQEEFQLIAQELSRAVGWAISYHELLTSNIDYLKSLLHQSDCPDSHIDNIQMVGMNRKSKMKCIARELRMRLLSHQTIVHDWSDDV
ncbi:hypothetical protein PCANC_26540 [Puccinia coronata f. sp. avenae]|uniref:CxC1-like cysteine cluster associated with KDZ transposases domain-containing protein n=1 Tax=Puccinia coronata f. sp. avenae TaxID=200324 RepID=A0A2N5TS27_9BASI|nr:hypothetical protein PCANC_26540 [Puccinia coronata f. sp. avenae]